MDVECIGSADAQRLAAGLPILFDSSDVCGLYTHLAISQTHILSCYPSMAALITTSICAIWLRSC
jgi:hypothetical protein